MKIKQPIRIWDRKLINLSSGSAIRTTGNSGKVNGLTETLENVSVGDECSNWCEKKLTGALLVHRSSVE